MPCTWGCQAVHLPLLLLLSVIAGTSGREVCNCSGRSQQCVFDADLLAQTGSGFRCINCNGNTEGPHCESCKIGYYPLPGGDCAPCNCHATGSLNSQCDIFGRCTCKAGVTGEKCDRCKPGFHTLTEAGCRRQGCHCDPAGTSRGCDTGEQCVCKATVTGERCDRCKPGYYNLDPSRAEGCIQCFCNGYSSSCTSSNKYSVHKITSSFQKDTEGWNSVLRDGTPASVPVRLSRHQKEVYLASRHQTPLYFSAPERYLGDQSLSYGQTLTISFRVDRGRHRAGAEDLVLEGNGLTVTAPLTTSRTALPCRLPQTYTFRLDGLSGSPWTPQISHFDFRRLLSNVTALRIRATYGEYSTGYLQSVNLVSARPVSGEAAPWVEKCVCPTGYQGNFCEKCAPGYRRDSTGLGSLSSCVACNCQGGGLCDPDTGDCYSGDQNLNNDCADCPQGYYNDPRDLQSCLPCPCGSGIGCFLSPETQEPVCEDCPVGLTGTRCEVCADGYFGDPQGQRGPQTPCRPCGCNNNIDLRVEGNCDRVTGECLKCIHNTAGFYCDQCREGFFGNPLDQNPQNKCKACYCHPVGTEHVGCQKDGSCRCKPGFNGASCDRPQCPSCYSQVSEKLNLYKTYLQEISSSNNSQSPASGELNARMKKAEEAARALLTEAESTHGAELSLQRKISGLQGTESELQTLLQQARGSLQAAQSQSSQYHGQLQDTRRKMEISRQQLEGGQAELARMQFSTSNLDPGAFSQLSQEAETIANRLAQEAQIVTQYATEAQGDTQRALQILRNGNVDPDSEARLRTRLEEARTRASALENEAIQSAAAAERAHQDSLQTARAVAQAARMDSVRFQEELERLGGESTALRSSVESELSQSKDLQNKFRIWEQDGEQQLQEGRVNKVLADQLLSRVNAAKTRAVQAMNTGNSSYYEIEGILSDLKGFGDKVGQRRSEAEAAMQRLPGIQRRVQAATDMTERAETSLKGAERDSGMAAGNAREALSITTAVQMDMQQMGRDTNSSAELALALERDLAELRRMTIGTGGDLETRMQDAERDSAASEGIVKNAQESETGALDANNAVTATLRALDHVLSLIDQPIGINEERLNSLESSLNAARTQVSGRLRPAVTDLEMAAERQRGRILGLETEISQTLIDIQNLRDIRNNLPPGCYNTAAIERP
ncbi:laminin subunit gamma-2 [Bombina bombina]|uniref:laminin subunit gamma-2 n=1 Tax=Bombina bombina TaxID=8345 RepID=UPI00235A9643|nr:laminin subunit gamma-2 [Bombina bombina]